MGKASGVPPANGWRVPFNGEIDNSMQIMTPPAFGAPAGKGGKPGLVPQMQHLTPQQLVAKRQEEAKNKMAEMQQKMAETKLKQEQTAASRVVAIRAANEIRKIVMKVKQATADNFDDMQIELQAIMETEMPNCGEQTERISQECEQAVEVTRKRVELINAKKKEEE